jgi:hypothetical protein
VKRTQQSECVAELSPKKHAKAQPARAKARPAIAPSQKAMLCPGIHSAKSHDPPDLGIARYITDVTV